MGNPDCPICLEDELVKELDEPLHPSEVKPLENMDSYTLYKCSHCGTVWAEGYIIIAHGEEE